MPDAPPLLSDRTRNVAGDLVFQAPVVVSGDATAPVSAKNFGLTGIVTPVGSTIGGSLQCSIDDGATWLPVRDLEGQPFSFVGGAGGEFIPIPLGEISSLPGKIRLLLESSADDTETFIFILRKLS